MKSTSFVARQYKLFGVLLQGRLGIWVSTLYLVRSNLDLLRC